MAFEGLKARLGVGGRQRRYVDIESVRDLDDISDPETTEDETRTKLLDWANDHPILATAAGIVALLVTAFVLFQASRFGRDLLTNPWTWRAAAATGIAVYSYRKGWRHHREKVADYDELALKMGDETVTYKGVYLDDLPGKANGFIPIKGWRKRGHEPKPYLNADLGAAMVESYNAYKMTADKPAVIRLQPFEVAETETDWGTRVVQRSQGLEPDPTGQHTSLAATLPKYDDERSNDLRKQLEQFAAENADLREEIQSHIRRVKDLKERLNEPINDEVDKRMEQIREFTETRDGRRQQSGGVNPRPQQDWTGTGAISGGGQAQQELEQVEQQVSSDDD